MMKPNSLRRCAALILVLCLFVCVSVPALAADTAADLEIYQFAEHYADLCGNVKNKSALSLFLMAAVPIESGVHSKLIVPVPYSDKIYTDLLKRGKSLFREYTSSNNFGLYAYPATGNYVGPLQIGSNYFTFAIAKDELFTSDRTNLPDSFNAVAGKMNNSLGIFKRLNNSRTLPNTKYGMVALYAIAHNYGESVFTLKDDAKTSVNGEIYRPSGAFNWAKAVGSAENVLMIQEYIQRKGILYYDQSTCKELVWAVYCNARASMIRTHGSFGNADIDGVSGENGHKREVFTAKEFSTSYLGSRNEKVMFPIKVLISAVIVEERYALCSWSGNLK